MSETSFLNSCNPPTLFDLIGKVFGIMLKITEFWILISTKEGKKKGRNICRFHLSLMYAGILWVNVVSVLFSSWGEMLLFFFSVSCLACHSDWGQAVGRTACFFDCMLHSQQDKNCTKGYSSSISIILFFFNNRTPIFLTGMHSFKATCDSKF